MDFIIGKNCKSPLSYSTDVSHFDSPPVGLKTLVTKVPLLTFRKYFASIQRFLKIKHKVPPGYVKESK